MELKQTQLAALQQAILLMGQFRGALPSVRNFIDAADSLTSEKVLGNARAEITTALAFGDPARAADEFTKANGAFAELNQLAAQIPQICGLLEQYKTAWDLLYPGLEVAEPVMQQIE